jgi:WD40 repeat protein
VRSDWLPRAPARHSLVGHRAPVTVSGYLADSKRVPTAHLFLFLVLSSLSPFTRGSLLLPLHRMTLRSKYALTIDRVDTVPVITIRMSQFWDFESGAFELTLRGHTNSVQCIAFDTTGNWLGMCRCRGSCAVSVPLHAALRLLQRRSQVICPSNCGTVAHRMT